MLIRASTHSNQVPLLSFSNQRTTVQVSLSQPLEHQALFVVINRDSEHIVDEQYDADLP